MEEFMTVGQYLKKERGAERGRHDNRAIKVLVDVNFSSDLAKFHSVVFE